MAIDLTETNRILAKYYKIGLPAELLIKILNKKGNEITLKEVKDGSIGDTAARDYIIHDILEELGMIEKWKGWPCNSDSHGHYLLFLAELDGAVINVDGTTGFDMEEIAKQLQKLSFECAEKSEEYSRGAFWAKSRADGLIIT